MAKLAYVLLFGLTSYVLNKTLISIDETHRNYLSKYLSFCHGARSGGSHNEKVKGKRLLSHPSNADIPDKDPGEKNRILRENLKQFLKTSLPLFNLSIGRMGDISFTVKTNVRDQTKESSKFLISLLGKSKNTKNLLKSRRVSSRAKQDLRELEEMINQLDTMIENGVKWSRVRK